MPNSQDKAPRVEKVMGSNLFENEPKDRKIFLQTAQDFLLDREIDEASLRLDDRGLAVKIQAEFQQNLERYFKESGLSEEVDILMNNSQTQQLATPLDMQALSLIAQKSQGIHGWVDMLPNLRKQYSNAGMNCTLASAMLHHALEKLGYSGVRTAVRDGHSIVFRELDDGSIQLYDSTSLSTINGEIVAYSRKFTPDQISNRQLVTEGDGKEGFATTLEIDEMDKIGGFTSKDDSEKFAVKFYAHNPSIKMDIAVAFGNLSEIQQDAEKLNTPSSRPFGQDTYKDSLVDFIRRNNMHELSDEEIKRIGQENRQTIVELLQIAERAFNGEVSIPNPFDYLQSDLLSPKLEITSIPDPKTFVDSSERYEQARELCERYPELKDLDFDTIKERFNLFDGSNYVK